MDPRHAMHETPTGEQLTAASAPAGPTEGEAAAGGTRRAFIGSAARKLAYAAPVVLLFHPQRACASGGSQITP